MHHRGAIEVYSRYFVVLVANGQKSMTGIIFSPLLASDEYFLYRWKAICQISPEGSPVLYIFLHRISV